MCIQSTLSKANTLGTKATVRFREVSALERVQLQRYKCNSAGSGPNLLSDLERVDCMYYLNILSLFRSHLSRWNRIILPFSHKSSWHVANHRLWRSCPPNEGKCDFCSHFVIAPAFHHNGTEKRDNVGDWPGNSPTPSLTDAITSNRPFYGKSWCGFLWTAVLSRPTHASDL